jgi:hypothetical protein
MDIQINVTKGELLTIGIGAEMLKEAVVRQLGLRLCENSPISKTAVPQWSVVVLTQP